MNTNTAKTTMWTAPHKTMALPGAEVSMFEMNARRTAPISVKATISGNKPEWARASRPAPGFHRHVKVEIDAADNVDFPETGLRHA